MRRPTLGSDPRFRRTQLLPKTASRLPVSPSYLRKSAPICGQKTKSQVAKNRCGNAFAFMLICPTIQNIHAIRSHAAPSKGCVPLFENLTTNTSAIGTQPSASAHTAQEESFVVRGSPDPVRNIAHLRALADTKFTQFCPPPHAQALYFPRFPRRACRSKRILY